MNVTKPFGTVVMFLMDVWMALGTFISILLLYLFIHVRKPEANWGSSTQSQVRSLKQLFIKQ